MTRLLYTIIISVFICVGISAVFFGEKMTFALIFKSIGLGSGIWIVSEIMFDIVLKKWPHQILPSYIALFSIIAIGTAAGTWLMGVVSIPIMLSICLCAEVFGFLIVILYRQSYKKRLNDKLERYKRE